MPPRFLHRRVQEPGGGEKREKWKSESQSELLLSRTLTDKASKYLIFSQEHFRSEHGRADVAGSRVRRHRNQRPNLPILCKHDEDVVTEFRANDLSRDPVDRFLGLSRSDERCHDEPCPRKTIKRKSEQTSGVAGATSPEQAVNILKKLHNEFLTQ